MGVKEIGGRMSEITEILKVVEHLLEATKEAHTAALHHEAELNLLVRELRQVKTEQEVQFRLLVGLLSRLDGVKLEHALQKTLDDMEAAEREQWNRRTA
jgi:hypothetical protein